MQPLRPRVAPDSPLARGSPHIEAGTNLSELITTDFAGTWDGVAAFDRGAYEYNPQTADSNTDGIADWWCHGYGLDATQPGLADTNPDHDYQRRLAFQQRAGACTGGWRVRSTLIIPGL